MSFIQSTRTPRPRWIKAPASSAALRAVCLLQVSRSAASFTEMNGAFGLAFAKGFIVPCLSAPLGGAIHARCGGHSIGTKKENRRVVFSLPFSEENAQTCGRPCALFPVNCFLLNFMITHLSWFYNRYINSCLEQRFENTFHYFCATFPATNMVIPSWALALYLSSPLYYTYYACFSSFFFSLLLALSLGLPLSLHLCFLLPVPLFPSLPL